MQLHGPTHPCALAWRYHFRSGVPYIGNFLWMRCWNGDLVRFLYFALGSESSSEVHRYISTGNGKGNPYGLAIAMGVVAPFLFYGRLYWSGPPMTNIIFFVTIVLVSAIFPYLYADLMLKSIPDCRILVAKHTHSYRIQLLGLASCMGRSSRAASSYHADRS